MRRPKFKINEPAFQTWITGQYGDERGRIARLIEALEPHGISAVSLHEYIRGETEPPLAFMYALAMINPETNIWALLRKSK